MARAPAGSRWKGRHWTRLRRAVQIAALLAFLALFVASRRGGWPPALVNAPMRLDPLTVLAHLLASRTLLAGSALALLTVALTLLLGRAWCGWLCPLGTLLDLVPLRRWRGRRPPPPDSWRRARYALLLTIVAAALLGNLTLLFFDPLTILWRALTTAIWPAADQLVTATEAALYRVAPLRPAISALDGLLRPDLLPPLPSFYRATLLYAGMLVAVLLLNVVAPRCWCRYLCPLGGLLGLLGKVSLLRRTVNERCRQCDACARACPTGTIQAARGYASDPAECTMCMDCLAACPHAAIDFPVRLGPAARQSYDPDRRTALAALGVAAAGVGLLRSDQRAHHPHPYLIRPPGASEDELLARCIRCMQCGRACPTGAIQPALDEAGAVGLWTPVLIPRLGYCDYSCNACGQVCPVGAIPPLSLEEKRQQVIGSAYIDQYRCLPWAERIDCIVCEEMCPVPDKAIWLEQAEVPDSTGAIVQIQRPHVIHERCIGCGICETRCPLNGEAAIRVRVPRLAPLATLWYNSLSVCNHHTRSWTARAVPGKQP